MITEKQREKRKNGIFASDIARIMSGEAVPLVLEKMGELEPTDYDDVLEVEVGNVIESKILDAYQLERPGLVLERRPEALEFFHPDFERLGCHLDTFATNLPINVEAKSVGDYNRKQYGEGGDDIPSRNLWQVLTQMTVTGVQSTEIPVCFLTPENLKRLITGKLPLINIYVVPHDAELGAYILRRSKEIWHCIETRQLPDIETNLDVKLIYSRDSGNLVEADEATMQAYLALMEVRGEIKSAEKREEEAILIIQKFMKDASELRWNNERLATWKKDKDSEQLDKKAIQEAYPRATKRFLKKRIGARKFLPKELKEVESPKLLEGDTNGS